MTIVDGEGVISVPEFLEFLRVRANPSVFNEIAEWIHVFQTDKEDIPACKNNDPALDAMLMVASREIVYTAISDNLQPLQTKFQQQRRKAGLEKDLAWLEIEAILDPQRRVAFLFKDAFAKDMMGILNEALKLQLKRIHSMFVW